MKINDIFRSLWIKLNSSTPPKPPKEPSGFLMDIRNIGRTVKRLLLYLLLLIFSICLLYIIILFIKGSFHIYAHDPRTGIDTDVTALAMLGSVVVGLMIIFMIYNGIDEKTRNLPKLLVEWFRNTKFYDWYSKFVYWLSKNYFDKIVFPNIDLIEPGLDGQTTDSFPNVVSYNRENTITSQSIMEILNNHLNAVKLLTLLIVVGLFVLGVPFGRIQFLSNLIFLSFSAALVSIYLLLFSPESLLRKRMEALRNEYARLKRDEWLQSRLDETEKYLGDTNGIVTKEYRERARELQKSLYEDLKKLIDVKNEIVVTQKEKEEAHILIRDKSDVVGFILNERDEILQKSLDTREKNKQWWNRAEGIVIGVLSTLIAKWLFGI